MDYFQITVTGPYENARDLEGLMKSWDIPSGAKKGPRLIIERSESNPNLWYAIANELRGELVCDRRDELSKYWKDHSNVTLQIAPQHQDYCFDFADAPFDKLQSFLEKPKHLIFPPLDILPDGCKRCFQNALDLTISAEGLLKQQNVLRHHVAFFLLTALEEFGKGLLILKQGKADTTTGKKASTMSFFRSHREKFDQASKQLREAWDHLVRRLKASGRPDALRLSDEEIPIILTRLRNPDELSRFKVKGIRHPGETYREQTLYVEYAGRSKEWINPQIRWSARELEILAKHIRIYCEIMIKEINGKGQINKVRDLQKVLTSPDFILPSDC